MHNEALDIALDHDGDPEIEVVTLVSGRVRDRATALDPEAAIRAAFMLVHDAETEGVNSTLIETNFYISGRLAATRKGAIA